MKPKPARIKPMKSKVVVMPNASFYLILIGLIICIAGLRLNFQVMKANEGRMPVETFKPYDDKDYFNFSYSTKDEVPYWYLSDVVGWETKTFIAHFSLGDLCIFLGLSLYIAGAIIQRLYDHKIRMKEKEEMKQEVRL